MTLEWSSPTQPLDFDDVLNLDGALFACEDPNGNTPITTSSSHLTWDPNAQLFTFTSGVVPPLDNLEEDLRVDYWSDLERSVFHEPNFCIPEPSLHLASCGVQYVPHNPQDEPPYHRSLSHDRDHRSAPNTRVDGTLASPMDKHEAKSNLTRTKISPETKLKLEAYFEIDPYPSKETMASISVDTTLPVNTIRNWFSNTRSRRPTP
jgi:hypothetical protein